MLNELFCILIIDRKINMLFVLKYKVVRKNVEVYLRIYIDFNK